MGLIGTCSTCSHMAMMTMTGWNPVLGMVGEWHHADEKLDQDHPAVCAETRPSRAAA